MEKFKVIFLPDNKIAEVPKGEDLLTAASLAGVRINSGCAGEGVCGKCKVMVKKGTVNDDSTSHLSEADRKKGFVLSCQAVVMSDLVIEIPSESRVEVDLKSVSSIYSRTEEISKGEGVVREDNFIFEPLVRKFYLELTKPDLNDKLSDIERIYVYLEEKFRISNTYSPLSNLKKLGLLLRESDWKVTVTLATKDSNFEIILIEPGDTTKKCFGVCFDIGTTTVNGQLVNLNTKEVLGTKASYNKQISFGDDVITRIMYASMEGGLLKLHNSVIENINEIIKELTEEHAVSFGDIYAINISGNTTMVHLLLGIDPTYIRREPYTATGNYFSPFKASEFNISINPRGYLYIVPGVASYVGGDIVAGVLSTGLSDNNDLGLLIDIGTNGEIALGNNEWMISCAASAGPAFEGSGMSCGLRAMNGAIEKIDISSDGRSVLFKTIGNDKPIGICGSGYIDIVAKFLKFGIISKNGKFSEDSSYSGRLRSVDGVKEFIIASQKEFKLEKDIVITENDIENLKRSKGAIYSAIATLVKKLELGLDDIRKIYIAGGFGTYLDAENAVYIGLLPDLPRDRFKFVGNSSLVGSREVLISDGARKKSYKIASELSYLELSAEPLYMDEYIKSLFFPHTEMERFKSLSLEYK